MVKIKSDIRQQINNHINFFLLAKSYDVFGRKKHQELLNKTLGTNTLILIGIVMVRSGMKNFKHKTLN